MKAIYLFIFGTLSCLAVQAQSPGFMGHRNVFTMTSSNIINKDLKLRASFMLSWERLYSRQHTIGFTMERLHLATDIRPFNSLPDQQLLSTAWGGGFYFKQYFFRFHDLLPPLGPYWRWDAQMFGGSSRSRYILPTAGNDTLGPVTDRFIYPAFGISLGASSVIKMRFVLDYGIRFKLVFPVAINVNPEMPLTGAGKTSFETMRDHDLLKFYIGIGFLQ